MKFLRCNTICSVLIPVSVILLSQNVMAAQESPRSPFLDDNDRMALDLEIASDYGECPVCMQPLYKLTPTVFTKPKTITVYQPGERVEAMWLSRAMAPRLVRKWHPAQYHRPGENGFHHTISFDTNPYRIYHRKEQDVRRPGSQGNNIIRVCRHLCCEACAKQIANASNDPDVPDRSTCPVCRETVTGYKAIPDLFQDPEGFFKAIDFDGDGVLNRMEINDILKGYFKVDPKNPNALEEHLEKNWHKWDADDNNTICRAEFMEYLLPFLKDVHKTLDGMKDCSEIPNWRHNPQDWFNFWDYDKSGKLDRPEVVRALAKTLKRPAEEICNVLKGIWNIFDPNGDGIDIEEFALEDGLWDTLMAIPPAELAAASAGPSAPRAYQVPPLARGWEKVKKNSRCTKCDKIVTTRESDADQCECGNSGGGWKADGDTEYRNIRTGVIQSHRPTKDDVEEHKRPNGYDF